MSTIQRLQAWYAKQCNGDWEHQHGVTISTLENPGWAIEISLLGTSAEASSFSPIKTERSEHDWLHALHLTFDVGRWMFDVHSLSRYSGRGSG